MVLMLIAYGTRQRDFTGRDRSIPKSGPGVLRVNHKPVRAASSRSRVVSYLAFQFDTGGTHRENQRLEFEFGRSCIEAGIQVVRKRFPISVPNAPVSIGKVAIVTCSNELSLDFDF